MFYPQQKCVDSKNCDDLLSVTTRTVVSLVVTSHFPFQACHNQRLFLAIAAW